MIKKIKRISKGEVVALEEATGIITLIFLIAGLLLLTPNITGNTIGNLNQTSSNYLGIIFFVIGLMGAFVYKLHGKITPVEGDSEYVKYRGTTRVHVKLLDRIKSGAKLKMPQLNSTGITSDYYNWFHEQTDKKAEEIKNIPLYSTVGSWEIYDGAINPISKDRIRELNRVTHWVNSSIERKSLNKEQFMAAHDIVVGLIYRGKGHRLGEYTPEMAREALKCLKEGKKYEEPAKPIQKKPKL